MRKTKIICTMGPNTDDEEMMRKLVKAGMDVARFNFSHGDHEEQKIRMDLLKKVRKELKLPIAILLDTKGPEIRTGILEGGQKVYLEEGSRFTLTTEQIEGNNTRCSQTYKNLPKDVKVGDTILIDDGLIQLTVENVTDTDVVCRVVNGGELGQKKGINVPNVEVKLPAITEQDKKDILFGIEQGIDFIAASFVRNAECILEIKAYLKELHAPYIPIIAKIENAEGIQNIDEIIRCADGIMIARGAQGNPWIFSEMITYEETGTLPERPGKEEVRDMMLRHARLQLKYKGEFIGIREMRKHVAWYTKGLKGSAKLREEINRVESYQELEELLFQRL